MDEYRLMWRIVEVARRHRTCVESAMSGVPIHGSQHRTLGAIEASGENISQKDLAALLKVSSAAVAVSLKKLERDGYISRDTSERDGRFNEIVVTDDGRAVLERGKAVFAEIDRCAFAGFTSEEKKILNGFLVRISDNLSGKEK